jgi:hypothetical protein
MPGNFRKFLIPFIKKEGAPIHNRRAAKQTELSVC